MADNALPFKDLRRFFFLENDVVLFKNLKVKCLLCSTKEEKYLKVPRTSSSNLKKHLRSIHPKEFAQFHLHPPENIEPSIPEVVDTPIAVKQEPVAVPEVSEPGTNITLEGTLWLETQGMIVVNVTYKGKAFSGTLLDCSYHDWAPSSNSDFQERLARTNLDNFMVTRSTAYKKGLKGATLSHRRTSPLGAAPTSTPSEPPRTRSNSKRKSETSEDTKKPQHGSNSKKTKAAVAHGTSPTPSNASLVSKTSPSSSTHHPKEAQSVIIEDAPINITAVSETDVANLSMNSSAKKPSKPEDILMQPNPKKDFPKLETGVCLVTNKNSSVSLSPETPESVRALGLSVPFVPQVLNQSNTQLQCTSQLEPSSNPQEFTSESSPRLPRNTQYKIKSSRCQSSAAPPINTGREQKNQPTRQIKEELSDQPQQYYCNPKGYVFDYPHNLFSGYTCPTPVSAQISNRPQTSTPNILPVPHKNEKILPQESLSTKPQRLTVPPSSYLCTGSDFIQPSYLGGVPYFPNLLPRPEIIVPGLYNSCPYPLLSPFSTPDDLARAGLSKIDFNAWRSYNQYYNTSPKLEGRAAESPAVKTLTDRPSSSESEWFKSGLSDEGAEDVLRVKSQDNLRLRNENEAVAPNEEETLVISD